MKNITFAERLKEARKAANLSQQALADKIGRTKSTISRWESGERNPKMFEMVELENILGIQARDLMFGEQEITDTILPKISQVSSELTKPRQEKVLNFATAQLDEQKLEENKIINLSEVDNRTSSLTAVETIEKVSAGFGFHYGENEKTTYYTSRNDLPRFDFATVVDGDSMEPTLHDGDVILIRQNYDTPQGGIYVVDYDGTSWVKEVSIDENELVLHSINEKYRDRFLPVPPEDGEYWNIVGEVVDWFTPEMI